MNKLEKIVFTTETLSPQSFAGLFNQNYLLCALCLRGEFCSGPRHSSRQYKG
jgi:hypothetical protein